MASKIASNEYLPMRTPKAKLSPLDAREKIYIEDGEIISLSTFSVIENPYPHLRVHVHQQTKDANGNVTGEKCIATYEIDEVEITNVLNPIKQTYSVSSVTVKSYHQVYSVSKGSSAVYFNDDLTVKDIYKDVIFFCTDDSTSMYYKAVLLNGVEFGQMDTSQMLHKTGNETKTGNLSVIGEIIVQDGALHDWTTISKSFIQMTGVEEGDATLISNTQVSQLPHGLNVGGVLKIDDVDITSVASSTSNGMMHKTDYEKLSRIVIAEDGCLYLCVGSKFYKFTPDNTYTDGYFSYNEDGLATFNEAGEVVNPEDPDQPVPVDPDTPVIPEEAIEEIVGQDGEG